MAQTSTKMNCITLVLAAGSVVISAATAGLSVIPNGSNIAVLQQQVSTLKQEKTALSAKLAAGIDNRNRIDELDIGLTAIVQVANIDREKLGKTIASLKAEDSKVKVDVPAKDAKSTASVAAEASHPQTEKVSAVSGVTPSSEPAKSPNSPTAKGAVQPTERTLVTSQDASTDNPFASTMDAPGGHISEPTGPLAVGSKKIAPANPLTIEQVDGILAKRLSENWYKPAGAKADLSAIIQVKMSRDGKVATVKLTKPSGNSAFDDSAINAVNAIVAISEVSQLSEADYKKAYASRSIQFTPQMGG